jgi:hypothetical protein
MKNLQKKTPKSRCSSFAASFAKKSHGHWIGLRENLQETMDFPIKYGAFL